MLVALVQAVWRRLVAGKVRRSKCTAVASLEAHFEDLGNFPWQLNCLRATRLEPLAHEYTTESAQRLVKSSLEINIRDVESCFDSYTDAERHANAQAGSWALASACLWVGPEAWGKRGHSGGAGDTYHPLP